MTNLAKKILLIVTSIQTHALDILFPIKCLVCQKEGEWLCQKCLSRFPLKNEQCCPFCEKVLTPGGRTCFACKKKIKLDALLVTSFYTYSPLVIAVHNYKYRFLKDLSLPLGTLATKAFLIQSFCVPDCIIPVPLHPRRLRWRGFNQSELLAKHLSENLTPAFPIEVTTQNLIRTHYTSPQMNIKNYQARKNNLQNAFEVIQKTSVQGKNILLVDDIATTGSTIFECAKILKLAGAKEVVAIVLARQEIEY